MELQEEYLNEMYDCYREWITDSDERSRLHRPADVVATLLSILHPATLTKYYSIETIPAFARTVAVEGNQLTVEVKADASFLNLWPYFLKGGFHMSGLGQIFAVTEQGTVTIRVDNQLIELIIEDGLVTSILECADQNEDVIVVSLMMKDSFFAQTLGDETAIIEELAQTPYNEDLPLDLSLLEAVHSSFVGHRRNTNQLISIRWRHHVDKKWAKKAFEPMNQQHPEWSKRAHRFGSAEEIPMVVQAIIVGDDPTRAIAWQELEQCIEHEGTVYSATRAVTVSLCQIAAYTDHPDRVRAMMLVWKIANADVASIKDSSEQWYDNDELCVNIRDTVEAAADDILGDWKESSPLVQRAQAVLLTQLSDARYRYHDLLNSILPNEYQQAWMICACRWSPDSTLTETDAIAVLNNWVHRASSSS